MPCACYGNFPNNVKPQDPLNYYTQERDRGNRGTDRFKVDP